MVKLGNIDNSPVESFIKLKHNILAGCTFLKYENHDSVYLRVVMFYLLNELQP